MIANAFLIMVIDQVIIMTKTHPSGQ